MAIKAVFTFERNHDRSWYETEPKTFNDEQHLKFYVRKCMQGHDVSRPKYINHRILHSNEEKIFNLNDMQRVFDLSKGDKYETLKDLLREEFKLRL